MRKGMYHQEDRLDLVLGECQLLVSVGVRMVTTDQAWPLVALGYCSSRVSERYINDYNSQYTLLRSLPIT